MAKKEEYIPSSYRAADRFGYYGPDGQYRTHKAHFAKPRVPVSRRISHAWRSLNKPRELAFSTSGKRIIIGLLLVFVLVSAFSSQSYLFPSLPSVQGDFNTSFSHTRSMITAHQALTSFSTGQWNFNSTCVSLATSNRWQFDYNLGTTGSGGNNCNSADILMLRSPMDISGVSAKQMEIYQSWQLLNAAADTVVSTLDLVFRTNETLPGFRENWSPSADREVRLLVRLCPSANGDCGVNGNIASYIPKDDTNSIDTETGANTIYTSQNAPSSNSGSNELFIQTVLNFTGSTHFNCYDNAAGTALSTSNPNTASPLQSAKLYYLFIKANFDTTVAPGGSAAIGWKSAVGNNRCSLVNTFYIASVPAACADGVNRANAACAIAATTGYSAPSLSDLNLFDPRTWVNALLKGLIWAGIQILSALSNVLGFLADVIITGLNAAGQFLGLGNLGTAIRDTFTGFVTWISSVLSVTVGQALNTATAIGNIITTVVTSASSFFAGVTGIFAEITNLFSYFWSSVANVWKIGTLGFKWIVMADLIAGIMMALHSVAEFQRWVWIQWNIVLGLLRIILTIGDKVTDLIAKIRTIGPRPAGI